MMNSKCGPVLRNRVKRLKENENVERLKTSLKLEKLNLKLQTLKFITETGIKVLSQFHLIFFHFFRIFQMTEIKN